MLKHLTNEQAFMYAGPRKERHMTPSEFVTACQQLSEAFAGACEAIELFAAAVVGDR